MTIRPLLIAITISACATSAFGQTANLLIIARSAPKGVKVLPAGYTTVAQHIIPRYMGGVTQGPLAYESYGPAGQLRGFGPASVIRGNADTQNQTVKAVVITEDYGSATPMSQWQGGTASQPTYLPAVLQAYVGGLTVLGHDEAGDNYANGPGSIDMLADGTTLYGGLFVESTGHTIEDITVFHIPGTAVISTRGEGTLRNGAIRPYDREKSFLRRIQVAWAYRGIEVIGNDSILADLEGQALRDWGLKFTAGSHQISGALHFWGVGAGSEPKAAIWFAAQAGQCWGGPIYAESSNRGMLIESSGNYLGPIYSKDCTTENIKISGQRNTLRLAAIDVMTGATGIKIEHLTDAVQYTTIHDGRIWMKATNAVGISIVAGNGKGHIIQGTKFLGSSATQGTGITTAAVLNQCTIDVKMQAVGTGIDLNPGGVSKVGDGNYISITTDIGGATGVDTPINLPDGWQNTTPTATTNTIIINGERYYPEP